MWTRSLFDKNGENSAGNQNQFNLRELDEVIAESSDQLDAEISKLEKTNSCKRTNQVVDQNQISMTESNGTTMSVEEQIRKLNEAVQQITNKFNLNERSRLETYEDVTVVPELSTDVSLNIFKTLPEFNGDRDKYATWRSITKTAIKVLENHSGTMRYYEALMIIRNKITGPASNILNNYNQG